MTERSIVEAAARLRRHGEPYLVATVVCVTGAGYRRPGARMILTRFRWVAGQVSGGCLEGDISSKGWSLTRDGAPALLRYDSTTANDDGNDDDDDDIRSAFGLGCDGVVEVLLERAGTAGRIDALEFAARCLRDHKRGAVTTVFRSDVPGITIGTRLALIADGAIADDSGSLDERVREQIAADMRDVIASGHSANRSYATAGGTIDVLIEAVLPPPRLFLCGTGHDAVPVATLARSMGWDVIVCSSEAKYSTRERFAMADEVLVGSPAELAARIGQSDRAVAVVMNHNADRDRESLAMLLGTKLQYIGVLGPRNRTRRLLRELAIDDEDPRVIGPIGLDLGAETPAELALAIVAELQAIVAGTSIADVGARRATQPYPVERVSGSGSMAAMAVAAPRK
ncbi:MAG: XdhC family protein [Deltaproteobacteria bacterium]|nr:XdhC family protein [Deltaproteobacteria bacterium]MDQ3295452.1 XdhC family protein [Myxococcota bacterium]